MDGLFVLFFFHKNINKFKKVNFVKLRDANSKRIIRSLIIERPWHSQLMRKPHQSVEASKSFKTQLLCNVAKVILDKLNMNTIYQEFLYLERTKSKL